MKKILLLFLLLFLILFDAYSYATTIQSEISDKVIRLHVIANSDTSYDQALKLKVRDSILKFMQDKQYDNYDVAYYSISNSIDELTQVAKNTLKINNCYDSVKIELGNFYFPQKEYTSLSFPSGNYKALKIIIGNGEGKNWWCVMYPTLCFSNSICSDTEAKLKLEQSLSKDGFSIIAKECKFRFKIVDFFNKH